MSRSSKQEKNSFGKAMLILLLSICCMFLFEPACVNLLGTVEASAEGSFSLSELFQLETPAPTAPAYAITDSYPETPEGFLPICSGKHTDEKIVALTIDDCNQAGNLRKIIQTISTYGGKGTIFPIGENVSFLAPILRSAAAQGFEIENHTQSHSGLYAQTDEELAYQIWQQNREVSLALGVDYQMHFLRPRGGDNRCDQRTHAYMRQMGYYGMAYWTQEGSLSTADQIISKLKPGDIILFHTTDYDLEVILELVPKLYSAGYRMVTLNEMFDLPENEQYPLTAEASVMPLESYERFDQVLKRSDYLHDVFLMQQRLISLGYLGGKCDGCFGANTENAIKRFQSDRGLEVNGTCDAETWNALFYQ